MCIVLICEVLQFSLVNKAVRNKSFSFFSLFQQMCYGVVFPGPVV